MKSDGNDILTGQIISELATCVSRVSSTSLERAAELMELAPRIFVHGAGRSGLCMRALGMRLMHLGTSVYVVGETITPGIAAGDLLVLGSGSGQTATLLTMAELSRRCGAMILLFTTAESSPLAKLANYQVIVPAPSLKNADESPDRTKSIQPMGTLFEQSLIILTDSLILRLMERKTIGAGQMFERHANLE